MARTQRGRRRMGKKKESPVTHITNKISRILKEIANAPPLEAHQDKEEFEQADESTKNVKTEIIEEETDDESSLIEEHERRREAYREEIIGRLNNATEQWKQTGELGMKLEPPIPLRDKAKA